jgi:RNA polymerase sigma factor (TIGR02999 family)
MEMNNPSATITSLLRCNNKQSMDEIVSLAYNKLQKIAKSLLRYDKAKYVLQTNGLVHEAYLRILKLDSIQWEDRRHFFAVWANIMRRILIDDARSRKALKRGGDNLLAPYSEELPQFGNATEVLALDDALHRLASIDSILSEVVELRFFGGLSVQETAEALSVSPATVKRKWIVARTWLYRELQPEYHASPH